MELDPSKMYLDDFKDALEVAYTFSFSQNHSLTICCHTALHLNPPIACGAVRIPPSYQLRPRRTYSGPSSFG